MNGEFIVLAFCFIKHRVHNLIYVGLRLWLKCQRNKFIIIFYVTFDSLNL